MVYIRVNFISTKLKTKKLSTEINEGNDIDQDGTLSTSGRDSPNNAPLACHFFFADTNHYDTHAVLRECENDPLAPTADCQNYSSPQQEHNAVEDELLVLENLPTSSSFSIIDPKNIVDSNKSEIKIEYVAEPVDTKPTPDQLVNIKTKRKSSPEQNLDVSIPAKKIKNGLSYYGGIEQKSVLRLNICEDVSITTESCSDQIRTSAENIVITPVAADPHDSSVTPVQSLFASGVHFLSHDSLVLSFPKQEPLDEPEDSSTEVMPARRELLEYLIQEDGSVVCKWCGEVLPSRTHWYRHKYKFHDQSPPGTTSLFKCYRCNMFFRSRKGYHGHITSRHSGIEKRPNVKEESESVIKSGFKELEEMALSRGRRSVKHIEDIPVEEYEKQREKEEKLVAEIIEKVKKECEAQGSTVTRRGYTRRQTVMNT